MTRYSMQQRSKGWTQWRSHSLNFYIGTKSRMVESGLNINRSIDERNIHDARKVLAYAREKWPRINFRLVKTVTKRTILED
jgi:hypothetical protein